MSEDIEQLQAKIKSLEAKLELYTHTPGALPAECDCYNCTLSWITTTEAKLVKTEARLSLAEAVVEAARHMKDTGYDEGEMRDFERALVTFDAKGGGK